VTGRGEAIVLIGLMGAGKSSVGRLLAHLTGLPRYETDALVAERFGVPIDDIFAVHGEAAFRDAESDIVQSLPEERAIIVTGGGVVLREHNVERLRALGTIVHLSASEETLFARLSQDAPRPLLQTADPRKTLSEMLQQRAPLYRSAADLVVETSAMTPEQVAEVVLQRVATVSVAAA
jgi:shikimate kinase